MRRERHVMRLSTVLFVAAASLAALSASAQPAPAPAATLLAAAFGEFATAGNGYADLHRRHLGVTQRAPDASSCSAWPGTVEGARPLRLGFVAELPLHTVDPAGRHVGFEADLAVELVRRINAHYRGARVTLEWVPVDVTLPVGPAKNFAAFNAQAAALRARKFDVAFSSIVPVPAADITYLCPTMTMFPGVAYTGRDGLDVSSIRDRPSFVAFLVKHPGLTFVHGMGKQVYDALARDVANAGGSIAVASAGTPHFRMADVLGLAKQRAAGAAVGTLLDVNPRLDIQPKAVFALKTP
jgi:hypothetical protein